MRLVHSSECQTSASLGGQAGHPSRHMSCPVPVDERKTGESRVKSYRKEEKTEKSLV
jgi:hypothetical protein